MPPRQPLVTASGSAVFTSNEIFAKIVIFAGQPETRFLASSLTRIRMKKFLLRKTFSITASAVIAGLAMGSAFGQAVKVVGDKPLFDDLQSPEYSGGGKQKPFKQGLA
jgi:hypothetical protein